MPEFQCSKNNNVEDACFDVYKIMAFSEALAGNMQDTLYYFDNFGNSRIVVTEVYPGNGNWTIYDQPKEDYRRISYYPIPITLKNSTNKFQPYSFGYLSIWIYS